MFKDNQSESTPLKFNIIIFSHGLGGHMHSSSILCKELASFGYLVFSIQHNEPILLQYELL